MDKTYQPASIETSWYKTWEGNNYFAPSGKGEAYSMVIPPPNVTGSLHMGHAFQHTIMDTLIRYQRMQGKNTLWQVGTDHAGIATQMVVERKLAAETGQTRHDLGRAAFTDKIWQWKEESGGNITRQMRRLGNSVDWSNERFTMDPKFQASVEHAFISLYDEGLIYRGKRLVNWDPKLQTAISDLEVESRDVQGKMWYLRYPLADGVTTDAGDDHIVVATTRPETMFGDTAIAVNPEDPRFQSIIGKFVKLPLVGRLIPIIGDEHADMAKGTGCVKITPAHDFNDYEVGKRRKLPMINILTLNADIREVGQGFHSDGSSNDEINCHIPEKYHAMERFAARREVVADFQALEFLVKIEENNMTIPYGDRGGVVIEPMLTDQWFADAKTLAQPTIKAVENGDIKFVPKQYENMFFSWMRDINDWCISRQLWWGHRIPAFYDQTGKVYVAATEEAARTKYHLSADTTLIQDNDVLDTWFSSGLWSFATLGWPEQTDDLETFHPTDTLVTGFDIIFFWVARMMMMSMHLCKDREGKPQIPFKNVYITGLVRDENGDKMSKSKGNVLDPLDMIDGISLPELLQKRTGNMMQPQMAEKIAKRTKKEYPEGISAHGTDALRFTLAALASTGRDINWDMKRLEGYRNFCNKIWNAARYVEMNTQGEDCGQGAGDVELSLADRWIGSKLQQIEIDTAKHIEEYRLDLAAQTLYDFIWNEYCGWYLELSKPVLWNEEASVAQKRGTRRTLVRVLEVIMRLCHPIMPYLTEEIWQSIKALAAVEGESIMLQSYPKPDLTAIDLDAEADIQWLKGVITGVRNIRGEMAISPATELSILISNGSETDQQRLNDNRTFLMKLASLSDITWLNPGDEAPMSATQLVGEMQVLVPMAGLIDKDAELSRLRKEIEKLDKEVGRIEGKLNNQKFVANAPQAVVAKEREKIAQFKAAQQKLLEQREKIAAL